MSIGISHYRLTKNVTDHMIILCNLTDGELNEFKSGIPGFDSYLQKSEVEVVDYDAMGIKDPSKWIFESQDYESVGFIDPDGNHVRMELKTKTIVTDVVYYEELEWQSTRSLWRKLVGKTKYFNFDVPTGHTIFTNKELKRFIDTYLCKGWAQNWANEKILSQFHQGTDFVSVG